MRIISTAYTNPALLDTMGRLALYNGMDVLTLFEIKEGLSELMDSTRWKTYRFEMDLQSALLEMSLNGAHVDQPARRGMTQEFTKTVNQLTKLLNEMLESIGYFDYYTRMAVHEFAVQSGLDITTLPTSWDEWKSRSIQWRREVKKLSGDYLVPYHKALKLGETFNPNSPVQKLKLFYHFFGIQENKVAQPYFYSPPWLKTKGIKEHKSRKTDGTYGPTADRSAMEKVIKASVKGEDTAAYLAAPFAHICLEIADLTKSLGFLKCKLDKGMFRASFGATTETGRLKSSKNPMGIASNAQNITPKLRHIFIAPPGWKLCSPDYAQIESRIVGAICFQLFGDKAYFAIGDSGDQHSLVASMIWPDLPWPESFTLENAIKYGAFSEDIIKEAKRVASEPFYRNKSRRDLSKTLAHGCLTKGHEVLTPNGWVDIATKPNTIMQIDGTFVTPSNWIDKEYEGTFIEWEGLSISVQMTTKHRVYYTTTGEGNLSDTYACLVPKSARILLGKNYEGGNVNEIYARLLAAYHCDGNYPGYNQTRFHFHKERKILRLHKLASEAGILVATRADNTNVVLNWIPELHAPDWSMLDWNKESLSAYMDELKYWDGHISDTAITLTSAKYDWLEKWQTFNRLLGKGGNIGKPYTSGFGSTVYRLQENNRLFASRASFTVDKKVQMKTQVYCPTVPKKAFYIRRNGKISVTGNSNYCGKPRQMSIQAHVDLPLVEHFQQAYFEAFPEIPKWHDWVAEQLQTTGEITTMLGRSRRFFDRPNDDATLRKAVAFEPQSTAADYTNKALLELVKASYGIGKYKDNKLDLKISAQVHDAIYGRFPIDKEIEVTKRMKEIMEQEVELTSPTGEVLKWKIPVDMESGFNLGYRTAKNPDGVGSVNLNQKRTPKKDWTEWKI